MNRVIVNLNDTEWKTLQQQAEREARPLRDQARWLILRGLAADVVAKLEAQPAAQPAGEGGSHATQQT
jgi:hypothetical protein